MKVGETFENWELFFEAFCKWRDEAYQPLFSLREAHTVKKKNKIVKKGFLDEKLKYKSCKIRCIHFGAYKSIATQVLYKVLIDL